MRHKLFVVALTIHVPEELAHRIRRAAAESDASPEQLAVEAIAIRFPPSTTGALVTSPQDDHGEDALEAFIGSGNSGLGDFAHRHREMLAEESTGQSASDL